MNAMRRLSKLFALAALATVSASCGDVVRDGRAPVFLVIELLEGSAGTDGQMSTFVQSDVLTKGSVVNDAGRATLRLAPKDIGNPLNPTTPSSNNAVTIRRYRVAYKRADGRNREGVDVPYAFDGAATGTVPPTGKIELPFELVRHVAKMESPLAQLALANPTVITTIAEVTFFGQDLVGNEITATGLIQVDFGNFADKDE